MYDGPIIDAHMHLWDLANGYRWLTERDANFERLIGNYDKLRRDFLAPDYITMTAGCNVAKSVHVQAFGFPDNPVGETAWLEQQADRYGYPSAVVAYADLTDPGIAETLREHCAFRRVRGVRMPLNYDAAPWRRMAVRGDYMRDARWRGGFALLAPQGLSFDMQLYDHQVPDAVALARDFPETTIVIEHLAWPTDPAGGYDRWSGYLAALAECPQASMKLSGIGCVFGKSDPAVPRRYLRRAVEIFAAERCLFGSNCPPDTLFYEFSELVARYKEALADLSPREQHAIFFGTAEHVYRL